MLLTREEGIVADENKAGHFSFSSKAQNKTNAGKHKQMQAPSTGFSLVFIRKSCEARDCALDNAGRFWFQVQKHENKKQNKNKKEQRGSTLLQSTLFFIEFRKTTTFQIFERGPMMATVADEDVYSLSSFELPLLLTELVLCPAFSAVESGVSPNNLGRLKSRSRTPAQSQTHRFQACT